jgi:hypothetical protein
LTEIVNEESDGVGWGGMGWGVGGNRSVWSGSVNSLKNGKSTSYGEIPGMSGSAPMLHFLLFL